MSQTADSVVVVLLADTSDYETKLKQASKTGAISLAEVENSAKKTGAAAGAIVPAVNAAAGALVGLGEGGQIAAAGATLLEGALTGGLSIAITAGVSLLGLLAAKLLGSGEAAEEADKGLEKFQHRQEDMARFIDQTTGKLIEQSRVLAQIAAQGLPTQIAGKNAETQGFVNQGFAAARATRGAESPFNVRGGRYEAGDPALDRAIAGAGSNVLTLNRNIAGLVAAGRTDLKPLSDQLAGFAGQANEAALNVLALKGQQVDLNTALSGGVVITSKMIERQVALATASDGVKKAQVALDAVRIKGAAIDGLNAGSKKTAALEAYRVELTAAENAVTAAEKARDAAKQASRDRAAASRESARDAKAEARAWEETTKAANGAVLAFTKWSKRTSLKDLGIDPAGDFKDVQRALDKSEDDRQTVSGNRFDGERKLRDEREKNIRTLAGLYEDLFTGGTRNLWQTFERLGISALANLAAKQSASGIFGLFAKVASLVTPIAGISTSGLTSALSGVSANISTPTGPFVPARASGGYVSAGSLYRVNEGASSGRVEGFRPSGSGTIIPLGQMANARGGGGTTVLQTLSFDLSGAVLTSDLLNQMNAMSEQAAVRGAAGGSSMAQGALARRARSRLG